MAKIFVADGRNAMLLRVAARICRKDRIDMVDLKDGRFAVTESVKASAPKKWGKLLARLKTVDGRTKDKALKALMT